MMLHRFRLSRPAAIAAVAAGLAAAAPAAALASTGSYGQAQHGGGLALRQGQPGL
jgi:hypothetical protein